MILDSIFMEEKGTWVGKGIFKTFLNGVGGIGFYILWSIFIGCWCSLTYEGNVILLELGVCSKGNLQRRVQWKVPTPLLEVGSWVFIHGDRSRSCVTSSCRNILPSRQTSVCAPTHIPTPCDFTSCLYLKYELLYHAFTLWRWKI